MAVDEVLWDWAGRTGQWCLRMYRWAAPTLSLGYFQDYQTRWQHQASRSCPVVRRISGGGAIVHAVEWTYSLAAPLSYAGASRSGNPSLDISIAHNQKGVLQEVSHQWLYEAVHGAIVELLAGLGVSASICHGPPSRQDASSPFLCFERRSPGDVLVGRHKVAGSAQRRSAAAVLQHGSLLLARTSAAPELPGLREIVGKDIVFDAILDAWLDHLSKRLELRWLPASLSQTERDAAHNLMVGKYASQDWIQYRCRKHSAGFC